MVVTGHDKHAAMGRGAVGISVLQCIAGAIDARTLAVPEREHAVGGPLRVGFDALRAEHGRRRQLLVDRRQDVDAGGVDAIADGGSSAAALALQTIARDHKKVLLLSGPATAGVPAPPKASGSVRTLGKDGPRGDSHESSAGWEIAHW